MKEESERHVGLVQSQEPELPLATEGVLRYVWHGRFGDMLIEVQDGAVFVNGAEVPGPEDARSTAEKLANRGG